MKIEDLIKDNLMIALAAVGIVLIVAIYGALTAFPSPQPINSTSISTLNYSIAIGTNPILGNENAPIAIVEFTDYQCPYCARHATQTFPQIEGNFVKAGKVKYYLRDMPLTAIHQNANNAAIAARCAGEQGKYWEMHTLLFSKVLDWESLSADAIKAKFEEYSTNLGLSVTSFSSCYESSKFAGNIATDTQQAKSYGITGTPASIIILPKTANEAKLLAVLSANPSYVSRGILSLSRDPQGNYIFFIKGAFPYDIFDSVLRAA